MDLLVFCRIFTTQRSSQTNVLNCEILLPVKMLVVIWVGRPCGLVGKCHYTPPFSALKMKTLYSSGTLALSAKSTRRYSPEDQQQMILFLMQAYPRHTHIYIVQFALQRKSINTGLKFHATKELMN
jgi:hypothetical protein